MQPDPKSALRDATWLTKDRAQAWCTVLAIMTGAGILGYLATSRGGMDITGKPLGPDFVSFWTASKLALSGQPSAAYIPSLHEAAQRALFPNAPPGYAAFFYPPMFLLLCLPLALLPYLVSLAVWLGAGFVPYYTGLRQLLPQRWAILPIVVFPGVLSNLGHGQNAFITAGCFAWSVALCRRRPFVAGLLLGLLVIKPQLLLAAPVALLAGRRWAIIAGGVTSGLTFAAVSWLAFGTQSWASFLADSRLARATLEQSLVEPYKMESVFAATRLLHGGVALGYALQLLVALVVCTILVRVNGRRPGVVPELVMLLLATQLCTPFLLDYDLTCLAVPIAWVTLQAQRTGWLGWEKIILLAAYLLPLVARPLAMATSLSAAPMVLAATLYVVVRRISTQSLPAEPAI